VQVRFGRALEPSGSNRPDERAYTELTARLRDSVDGMMSPRAVAD
jgi:hypothetical protein